MESSSDKSLIAAKSPNGYSVWFIVIVALLITSQLASSILAVKLVQVGPLVFDGALVLFPLSYICGDVIAEIYGYHQARRAIWLAFLCNFLIVGSTAVVQWLPPAPHWNDQDAFETILGVVPRIVLASFLANLSGEFINAGVLSRLKVVTRGRGLWFRCVSSTFISQGINSLIFYSLAYWGTVPGLEILWGILSSWGFKTGYEVIALPLTYAAVNFLKRQEQLDIYDYRVNYTPFSLAIGKKK
uniref:Probable queuosine precursor transporter n=1 Tax=Cyanothece sp. (strain PCC 7425 / ATCC 29141) TaxID=395961 RepID=B8HNW8_CYAP4